MQNRHYSMKWKMIRSLLICWLIPFLLLFGVLGIYMGTKHSDTTARNYQSQLAFNSQISVDRLNLAVTLSREASYDGKILQIKKQYLQGLVSYDDAKNEVDEYLSSKYRQSDLISSIVLWCRDEEGTIHSTGYYNEKADGSYQQLRSYWMSDHEAVSELADMLDTKVGFLARNQKLYLVRNMMDSHYQVQAVLVFCLNQQYCFRSVLQYPMQDDICIWINDGVPLPIAEEQQTDWQKLYEEAGEQRYRWYKDRLYVTEEEKGDRFTFRCALKIQKSVTKFPFYGYPYIMAGMLLALILTLYTVLRVFRKEVTRPIQVLSDGMRRIEEGELGYQITEEPNNLEFQYLTDTVNHLSENLRQQFVKIYQEEIALRDARIMALQAHINPHFLNNTLEIINWDARLGENEKVSKMIEALSNMLDAALDRRKRHAIRLEEEMGYVSSYLFIMKERLGKRLQVEIRIPEELMDCMVPRLILQPVIENAIEHGVVPNSSGTVEIRGRLEGEFFYLEVLNDGALTEADRQKIARLLDPEYDTSKESSGNIGIANVNQRLRILYGEPCGLTLEGENKKTTARLTIPYHT